SVEIKLSTVKKALVVLLVVFAAIAAVRFGLPMFNTAQAEPEPTAVPDGREAAIAGLTALFSVDVTTGYDAWLQSVCAVSTENGCAFAELFANWDRVVETKARSEYRVQAAELRKDLGDRQVWMVTGAIHDLNTGEEKGGEIPVLVVRENGEWKFDHFLFEQELQALEAQP
ncbi:MAG: hypothetical protein ACK4SN_16305, partial [Bellilinea sp.]